MEDKNKQYKRFAQLDEEWRSSMLSASTEEVTKKISTVAMNDYQMHMAQKNDPDLNELKEKLKTANAPYSDAYKTNKIRIEFLTEVLRSRGENVPSIEDFLKSAANGENDE